MMAYVNSSHYIWKEVYGDKPEDLPKISMVKENARLWFKVAKLHIQDLEDMENNVAALRNSLPAVISVPTGKIPFQAQYAPTPGANLYKVNAFCDTQDHLLMLTMSGTHYSKPCIRCPSHSPTSMSPMSSQLPAHYHYHQLDYHKGKWLGPIRILWGQGCQAGLPASDNANPGSNGVHPRLAKM
jgi:hypothetical protein